MVLAGLDFWGRRCHKLQNRNVSILESPPVGKYSPRHKPRSRFARIRGRGFLFNEAQRLATAKSEHVRAGARPIEVTRVRITEAGRQLLAQKLV
jgi:hypothetical protein